MLLFLELIPYIVIFIFGITIGNFLNVCIYRMPLHESIVTAPSHCMTCGSRLHWYDMVPVFSWLILGGKCRNCKTKISAQYPVIEALNGALYVLVCAVNGLNGMSAIYCLMTSALIVLSLIDWRTYEIPISVNVFLGILGIAAVVVQPEAWMTHLVGALCVSGILLVIYLVSGGRAIGGGDIKLMAARGLILGWQLFIFPWMHHWLCDPSYSYTGRRGRAYAGDGALSVSGHFYSRIMGKQLDSLVYGHAWNLMKVSGRLISQKVTEK